MPRKAKKRAPGLGSIIASPGGTWRIRWRENGRRRIASGFTSRELAAQILHKVLSDLAAGRGGLPRDPKSVPPMAELADEWLERRRFTHRSHRDDRSRWVNHLGPFFKHHRPAEVTPAEIRRFAETKLLAGLSSTSVGHCIRLLSTLFTDLIERNLADANPVRALPRSTRRLFRNAHDSRTTPFLESMGDVRRIFLALPRRYGVAFAVGALGGLRPGEVLGLAWRDVDLAGQRITVRQQVHRGQLGPVKDDEARIVPILKPLVPILAEWKLLTGGEGLVFNPLAPGRGGRPGSPATYVREHTIGKQLRRALAACGLPRLTWYQATRHTFASQWAMAGGGIAQLAMILGHSHTTTSERYAHLRPGNFTERELSMLEVDLSSGEAAVLKLPPRSDSAGEVGHNLGTKLKESAGDGR